MSRPTTIAILGGGFAGIRAAHLLSKHARQDNLSVILIDRESSHINTPGLYEIASAFVPWEKEGIGRIMREVAGVPFRAILDGTNTNFIQGRIARILPGSRTVVLDDGRELAADILLLGIGSQTNTFGVPGVSQYAFGVKTFHEAAELRHHIVSLFHRHRSASRKTQERAFTLVVAGGGSAGVETAAELRLFQRKLAKLHGIDPSIPRVVLCEAGQGILREYPPRLQKRGRERLTALGVHMYFRCSVRAVSADRVEFASGTSHATETVVWLCGIRAHDLLLQAGLPVHPRGGVIVENTLEVHGHRNIFAAGDCVYAADATTGLVVPDVAWAALQQGSVVAENILRRVHGEALTAYLPHPRPTLATVGGKYALVYLHPFNFAGRFGWFVKQFVDLAYLWRILPNGLAVRSWLKTLRVRVANDAV